MGPKADQLYQWQNLSSGFSLGRSEFGAVSINEAIAAADRFSACARSDSTDPSDSLAKWGHEYGELARAYSWFRDKQGAQTVADVLDAFEQRKIDLSIVRLLALDLNSLPSGQLTTAIRLGYPELGAELTDRHTAAVEDSLARSRDMIDGLE